MSDAIRTEAPVRWVEPFAYTEGAPLPVMPIGQFKRGGRTLDISPADLAEMAANYQAGRPRWDIPIYAGHPVDGQPEPGRLGIATRMYVQDGMLLADVEWTPEGEQVASSGQYGYTSPGVIWSKNGARYDDGKGGKFDNVVEHIALTNMPFFGQHTALFSAHEIPGLEASMSDPTPTPTAETEAPAEEFGDHSDAQFKTMRKAFERMQALVSEMAQVAQDWAAELPEHKRPGGSVLPGMPAPESPMADASGETDEAKCKPKNANMSADTGAEAFDGGEGEDEMKLPDMEFVHQLACALNDVGVALIGASTLNDLSAMDLVMAKESIKSALKSLIDQYDADAHGAAMSAALSGKENPMSEVTTPAVETAAAPSGSEDFAAIQAAQQAERFAALEAKLAEANAQVEAFKAQAAEAAKAQRLSEIRARVDGFSALGVDHAELAAKLQTLELLDADLFGYFDGLLATADGAIAKAEPFTAKSEEHTETHDETPDNFAAAVKRIHTDEFKSDPDKLAAAMIVAQERHPDLFEQQYRA